MKEDSLSAQNIFDQLEAAIEKEDEISFQTNFEKIIHRKLSQRINPENGSNYGRGCISWDYRYYKKKNSDEIGICGPYAYYIYYIRTKRFKKYLGRNVSDALRKIDSILEDLSCTSV